ncbi:MAG: hypothetical protein PUG70_00830 [Lachnospiraceae bacterium]|nr:hypothetical protein [Lachnospiraceae bacterium]MDY5521643.1 hypothetical protein [Agathobacter sp.]
MRQITLNLDGSYRRPVAVLQNGLRAMLDTGAFIPVWTDNEEILVKMMGAKFLQSNVPISGFGGTTYGNLYQVTLNIGDLIFPNMPIVANNELDPPFNMILSATMFSGLIYEVDTVNNVLNINVPDAESFIRNLTFDNGKGGRIVLCTTQDNPSQIKI